MYEMVREDFGSRIRKTNLLFIRLLHSLLLPNPKLHTRYFFVLNYKCKTNHCRKECLYVLHEYIHKC